MSASSLIRKIGNPPNQAANEPPINVSNDSHNDAVRFYNEVVRQDCTHILNFIWGTYKLCATLYAQHEDRNEIVGAAWGRMYDSVSMLNDKQHVRGVFVGPVVAVSDVYARVAAAHVIRQASERFCNDQDGSIETMILATNVNGSHDSVDIFGELGFVEASRNKFMVLQDETHSPSSTAHHEDVPVLDLKSTNLHRYFGVPAYDIG